MQVNGHVSTGYNLSLSRDPKGYKSENIGELATQILRYLLHSTMLLSAALFSQNRAIIARLLFPESSSPNVEYSLEILQGLKQQDWDAMALTSGFSDENLCAGIHLVLDRIISRVESEFIPSARDFFEV